MRQKKTTLMSCLVVHREIYNDQASIQQREKYNKFTVMFIVMYIVIKYN